MRRRMALPWLALASAASAAALLLAACGDGGEASDALTWSARDINASQQDAPMPVHVNSNLGVGPNRFALALFDDAQQPIGGASVHARFYRLAEKPDEQPEVSTFVSETDLVTRSLVPSTDHVHGDGTVHKHEGAPATIYVANTTFDQEGWWGASLDIEADGEAHEGVQFRFFVAQDTAEPSIGDPAPPTEQRTVDDVDDISLIDSSVDPIPEMHDTTVAQALESGKPFVVAFVTPAFCQTQFCGPVLEQVVTPVWDEYGDRVEFMHIEPYDLEQARQGKLVAVEATQQWGLLSEPFVFVVDAEGKVAAKFEGIMEVEEVRAAVESVLQGSPPAAATSAATAAAPSSSDGLGY